MPIIKQVKDRAWFFLQRNRRNRVIARFARLCKNIHRATEHATHDTMVNGERDAVMRLAGGPNPVIFDVGANIGDWTRLTLDLFPTATIHSFELNPLTAEKLAARFAADSNVHIHAFGLAERNAEIEFYAFSGQESVLSTTRTPLYSHVPHTKAMARLVRGDEFCRDHGIDFIHFLKIDAENADMEVLQGFSTLLENGKIGCLQFEHQGGRFLKEFYDFLQPKGFSLGKLYANYIDFREHDADMEDLLGPNYVALPARETAKIQEMIKGW